MAKVASQQATNKANEVDVAEAASSTDLDIDDNGTCDSDDEGFSEIGEVGDTEVRAVRMLQQYW